MGLISCAKHKVKITQLGLIKSYEVITNNSLEPSGLTLWDDVFYTVSDKADFIYRLDFIGDKIKLNPLIKIINDKGTKLDFEGITHDNDSFYLISEKYFQIRKISFDGTQQSWLPNNDKLKQAGIKAGLFQTKNANFEGICYLGNNKFLLAAERQHRGFIEVDFDQDNSKAYTVDKPVYHYQQERSPDFTGLSCDDGIYVLDRNAETVGKLQMINGKYAETTGYSYQHIINQPQLQYQDNKYGHAEGLVVKGNKVYIILDNNRSYHSQDTENNNSIFLYLNK